MTQPVSGAAVNYSIPVQSGIKKTEGEVFEYSALNTIRDLNQWVLAQHGIPPMNQRLLVVYDSIYGILSVFQRLFVGSRQPKELVNASNELLIDSLQDAKRILIYLKTQS